MDATVNALDRWGGTPLRDALREGHMEVAKALACHGGVLGYNEAETSGELCEVGSTIQTLRRPKFVTCAR
eukprot:6585981-Prymnesium_polylepis.1